MSPLLPIAGTAALSLAGETVAAIGSGLSFATELLRQDNDVARAASPPPPIELPRSAAHNQFEQALREFVARLRQRLASAGIDLQGIVELKGDGLGGVRAEADQADEFALEQVLTDDPQLLAEFNRLAEHYDSLNNGNDLHRDFGVLIAADNAEVISY